MLITLKSNGKINGISLNLNKRKIWDKSDRTEHIQAFQEALEVNNGRLHAKRNGLGISTSSFCRITKKTFVGTLIKLFDTSFMKMILK